jgi:microsomal dipeptidase-like Zn-dependent dipeptidase
MTVDLTGAADLHCHFGPDPHRERSVDAFEAAHEADAAGHRAVVLKSHEFPTAALAWAVQHDTGDAISVFGGICCDREVGGMNPAAVEVALGLGARIVWLPTLSSRQDFENGVAARLGIPGPGLVVTGDDGELSPETKEVLALVREHGAVLATGHVSAAEHYAVTRALASVAPVVLTHATEDLAGPKLTTAQCRELADLGAWVELCAMTCVGALASQTVAQMIETIRAVGVERVTLGTDFGQQVNPHPAAGLQTYADALYAEGLTEAEIRCMACTNPTTVLGIE